MFRANVYSLEPLAPEINEAVHDGIAMTAANMDQQVSSRNVAVRLPRNQDGKVNPSKIGLGKLNNLVELHLMAVPLDRGEDERLGIAKLGLGSAFVDISSDRVEVVRSVAAHETAHAFGFVSDGASHASEEDPHHCCDDSCIMHGRLIDFVIEKQVLAKRRFADRFKKIITKNYAPDTEWVTVREIDQFDFCSPCKTDMWCNAEEHLSKLRHNRLFVHKKVL